MSSLGIDLYRYIAASQNSAELGVIANSSKFREYGRRRISRELDALCESGRLFRSAVRGKYYYSVKNDGSGEHCSPFKARLLGISFDAESDTADLFLDDDEFVSPPMDNSANEITLPSIQYDEDDEIILPPIQQTDNPANEITLPPMQNDEDDEIELPPIQQTDNPANEITLPPILDDEDDKIILPPIQQTDNPANEITLPPILDDEDDEIILPPIQPTDNPANEITLPPIQDDEDDEIILPPIQQTDNPVNEITLSPIPDEEYDEIVLPPTNQTENTFGDNRRDTVGVTLPAHNQLYREYVQLPSQIARLKREIAEGERKLVSLEDERKRTAAEEQNAHEEHDDKLAARNREEEHSANMYGNVLRMRASEETRIEQTLAALDNQRRETVKELESLSVFSVVKKRDLNKLIEDIDNRISSARRDMDAVHSSMEELKKQQQNDTALQNAERELEFARNRYEQIRISLERKESEIAVCRKDIVQKKGELEMCEQRLEQLRKEISDGRT